MNRAVTYSISESDSSNGDLRSSSQYFTSSQSYSTLQKFTRFTEAIRENTEIWQALNISVKTSEMLELDRPPSLKAVINEIFT